MLLFNEIVTLSMKIATSLLKDEKPVDLEKSKIFNEKEKTHILKNITDTTLLEERFSLINGIDKKKDWKIIQNKIQPPIRKLVLWKYVAAASIVLLVSIGFLFQNKNIPTKNIPTVASDAIMPGSEKAILTLGNGSQIALGKGKSYQTKQVNSNGEKLIYTNGDDSKEITYNYLTIPRGGQFFVQLADGTKVWLNSESQLKYPVAFTDGKTRNVELVYGEAYFEVSPSTAHKGARFKVFNKMQEVEVLGTQFNIKAYKDETAIYTTLVEGKVAISTATTKEHLVPNQQANLNLKNGNLSIGKVDVYNEISWKDGVFSFERKPLRDIMTVLSRWYDMDVVFENKSVENAKFIGVLGKDQPIEDILTTVKATNIITNYKIEGKTIHIK
jgi:hypothetical protein